jgi:enoyl-CoA hydratase/carnithine racemase
MSARMISERDGSTLVLTLSDPASRNSLSPQACAAGVEALGHAESDPALRCIVLRGDGEHFCAGGNVPRLAAARQGAPEQQAQSMEHLLQFVEALHACPKPVIAAVEGFAAGAGFSLVLTCDLVVAARDARFVLSHGRLGLSPDGGATWQLARRLPRGRALQIAWLPEPVDAPQALADGWVTQLADKGHALAQALALAGRLARMAPNALASSKRLLDEAPQATLREQLDREREHFVRNLFDPNGGEGLQAFLDKRAPDFR